MLEAHAAAGRVPADVVEPVRAAPPPTPAAGRRDRGDDAARRHRLPHRLGGQHRAAVGGRLRAPRDDVVRPAGHRAGRAADRGHRRAAGQGRPAGRGAARPRPGAPGHDQGRPHARHARRARRVGPPGRRPRLRGGPVPGPAARGPRRAVGVVAISGAVGTYSLHRPVGRGLRRRRARAARRRTPPPRWCCATRSASGCPRWRSSRPSARRSRWRCGTASAPRCGSCRRRSGRARRARARCRTRRTRSGPSGSPAWPGWCAAAIVPVMEGIPLWHERDISHSSTERVVPARRRDHHRLPAAPDRRPGREPGGRRRPDAGQPGVHRRADLHLVGAAGAGRGRAVPGGRLRAGAVGGDGDLEGRDAVPGDAARAGGRRPASTLDEARLDEICRPERYVANLGPLFDRLALRCR